MRFEHAASYCFHVPCLRNCDAGHSGVDPCAHAGPLDGQARRERGPSLHPRPALCGELRKPSEALSENQPSGRQSPDSWASGSTPLRSGQALERCSFTFHKRDSLKIEVSAAGGSVPPGKRREDAGGTFGWTQAAAIPTPYLFREERTAAAPSPGPQVQVPAPLPSSCRAVHNAGSNA